MSRKCTIIPSWGLLSSLSEPLVFKQSFLVATLYTRALLLIHHRIFVPMSPCLFAFLKAEFHLETIQCKKIKTKAVK